MLHDSTISLSLVFFSFLAEKLLVLLRDGRKLMGLLRSFDQFGISCVHFSLFFTENPKSLKPVFSFS